MKKHVTWHATWNLKAISNRRKVFESMRLSLRESYQHFRLREELQKLHLPLSTALTYNVLVSYFHYIYNCFLVSQMGKIKRKLRSLRNWGKSANSTYHALQNDLSREHDSETTYLRRDEGAEFLESMWVKIVRCFDHQFLF